MKTHLIKIGNSQGIRIPKLLLEQAHLHDQVEVEAHADRLVIRAVQHSPREGWEEQFRLMAERGDDKLLLPETTTEWENEEWEW